MSVARTAAETPLVHRELFALQPTPRPLRVVAIGGGTGLPTVLRGLRRVGRRLSSALSLDITAIVAVGDDGGSSGRLRKDHGLLPPGDVRRCLVALSENEDSLLARLFEHRFLAGRELAGHSTGNLLLAALADLEGDFLAGIRRAERLLGCVGRVLPATLERIVLVGICEDGSRVVGQHRFAENRERRIRRVETIPPAPPPTPGVIEAILNADVVIMGPGSLYSSVIANLLVDGVAEALRRRKGRRILIQNLACQPGESRGMSAAAHVEAVLTHAGNVVDVLLVDSRARFAAREGEDRVSCDPEAVLALGVRPVEAELIAPTGRLAHDPDKTALAIVALTMAALEA
nr:MAG: YvcK family protein [Pseudomonadota bacterium]